MRAIDLYAGVGGWSLGLKASGIDVIASYEWWSPAVETHRANFAGCVHQEDIRNLPLELLPTEVDLVVGSPPCTQFSFANRGGSGDLADGLLDIKAFLRVVAAVKPKYWVFENVPRVAPIMRQIISEMPADFVEYANQLAGAEVHVISADDFCTPQSRKRCLVGNIDFENFLGLARKNSGVSLGQVISDLHRGDDPVYAAAISADITDMEKEAALNEQEARFNREMKTNHPIYNGMAFPDTLQRPSRTITSTCTRVSRESIIVEDHEAPGQFRRLSVRERASIQAFPTDFQFHGKTHTEKLKMIGNALPPTISLAIGLSLNCPGESLSVRLASLTFGEVIKRSSPPQTHPEIAGRSYPANRRFRFSIPNLRFKSGMRFELSNALDCWQVRFFFGDSKTILEVNQANLDVNAMCSSLGIGRKQLGKVREQLNEVLARFDPVAIQQEWSGKSGSSSGGPFNLIDELGSFVLEIQSDLLININEQELADVVVVNLRAGLNKFVGENKVRKYGPEIMAGLILMSFFNTRFANMPIATAA